MLSPLCRVLAFALLLVPAASLLAQAPPLASAELEVRGNRLSIYADEASNANDARQTLNIGERGRVRTCFGGQALPCGSLQAGDPRIAGLEVAAELSGPELPEPLALVTVPGGSFVLPGFQQEGEYTLENIRLVNAESGQVIALAEPSLAILTVRQIVLTSATVRALTLAELRARGIELTEENFQAFDFAVGFAFGTEIVEIEFPVTFEGQGTVGAIGKPQVKLDELPPGVVQEVARWTPPTLVPFRLAPAERVEGESFFIGEEEQQELVFPVYGVIVLPGTVTYLNQFFDASLLVANGAPGNSGAVLRDLRAAIKLPGNQSLRLARTEPPVSPGQDLPVLAENGSQQLGPGEKGQVSWTLEGLKPGTHGVFMDLKAELHRPGRPPMPLTSRSQAAVEVVDARFHLTFSHPDVVREGEQYTLYVTVANESLAAQNLITVELKRNNLSGAHPASENDDLKRTIETLAPGQSETLEFELISDITGQVVATTFQAESSAGLGTIQLRAGVGELGIPLSPATLVLPRYSEHLKALAGNELMRANNRLLGLAYSLAVAPASALPPSIAGISKSEVERRAVDIGEAGQRIFLGAGLLPSAEVLALDQLGNRKGFEGFDQLRRQTTKGLRAGGELAKVLRAEQDRLDLSAGAFFEHFKNTTSYAEPFLAAVAYPSDSGSAVELEIRGYRSAEGTAAFAGEDESRAVRTLPYAEIFRIRGEPDQAARPASFGLVGRVEAGQAFTVEIVNPEAGQSNVRLLLMIPDGEGGFLRADYGTVSLPGNGRLAANIGSGLDLRLYDPVSLALRPAQPSLGSIPLPPFEIIGIRQEFRLIHTVDASGNHIIPNRYGHGLTYLFNRPPSSSIEAHPDAFSVISQFDGEDVLGNPVTGTTNKVGDSVFIQDSERVVNVLYSGSISPLMEIADGVTPLIDHEHDLEESKIVDRAGNAVAGSVPEIVLERVPPHTGGLVGGRVLRGNGNGVAGAKVELIRQREFMVRDGTIIKLDPTAVTETDADGRYFFDFVENPIGMPIRRTVLIRATVPAGENPVTEPAAVEEVGTIIRQNNAMANVNIALLGRGAISGHLLYADTQEPVFEGRVEAASTLFGELKSTQVAAADGAFRFEAVAVGPITLTGRDKQGRTVYATVEVEQSGSEVEGVELQLPRLPPPGLGTVRGRVLIRRGTQDFPAPGAKIACYTAGHLFALKETGEDGSFLFAGVPAGQVSLQAADFGISRTAVLQDQMLTVGGTVEATLRLPETLPKTITGEVFVRDVLTNTRTPLVGAPVFVVGPGNYSRTDAAGRYVITGVPTQANGEPPYQLKAIDQVHNREASTYLPVLVESTPDPLIAATMTIEIGEQIGGVRGRVLDPFGNPAGGVDLVLYPLREGVSTAPDGSFFFPNVPVGAYEVVAHHGDGLEPGRVGYFGKTGTQVSFPGHQPFVTVSLVGAGTVRVKTRTATSTGILSPIYYRPTYYSQAEKNIAIRGQYFETTTNTNGDLELQLPVGAYEIVAFNPFHGTKKILGQVDSPGQSISHEIIFEDAGKVSGQVVGPDGVTPVPFAEVVMRTGAFLPQTQVATALGRFEFYLVPKGPVALEARGQDGAVERVGSILTYITMGGQEIDVKVQLKRQGTVRGRVVETVGGTKQAVGSAQYAVYENSFPFRRFPEDGSYYVADAEGGYEVSHLFAGDVTVIGRHPLHPDRSKQVRAKLEADWQVLDMPDIDLGGELAVGRIEILVRDSATGAPVPDAQVRLSNGEITVAGADGRAIFEALRLNTYSVYVFYAPSGRSGRAAGLALTHGGQVVEETIDLDQRGKVSGTVWEGRPLVTPVPGAVVELKASTAGGSVVALATTHTDAAYLGQFEFLGIPESDFVLTAAQQTSPRRGVEPNGKISATSPEPDYNIVLEALSDVHLRLYEKLTSGVQPVDPEASLFSVRLRQPAPSGGYLYDYTRLEPEAGGAFYFPGLLIDRAGTFDARELTGDLRNGGATLQRLTPPAALPGSGSPDDPFRLTLGAKGMVRATVLSAGGTPMPGITVRLGNTGLATDAEGKAIFAAVTAGHQTVTATNPATGQAGYASGYLEFDDQTLELSISLAAAVSAAGTVYQPAPGDRHVQDPASQLPPLAGAVVELVDFRGRRQVQLTDEAGRYRFDALNTGNYSIVARNYNGEWEVRSAGNLQGADGSLIELPPLVLDSSPPRLVAISPAAGATGISRDTMVTLTFNEPLADHVQPSGSLSNFFSFKLGNATVAGIWTFKSVNGQDVVTFDPAGLLDNFSVYSISIKGGAYGVVDRQNRPLTTAAFIGSSFRTGDSFGPTISSTVPRLDRPVDPEVALRFDFSESVLATPEMLDGDFFEDAALMEAQRHDGSWVTLPIVQYLTRSDFSLQIERFFGVGLPPEEDSGRRRLTIGRLKDAAGNAMADKTYQFRLYDENPPVFDELPLPEGAPDGNLYHGASYTLVPILSGLDDLSPENPGGDIDRVEYYLDDPDLPGASPSIAGIANSYPFAFGFIAPSTSSEPVPRHYWARAFDTSLNVSQTRHVALQVLPNALPIAGVVTLAPVDASLYPGDSLVATVQGFSDLDGAELTIALRIRRLDTGAQLGQTLTVTRSRPAGGWPAAPAVTLTAVLPKDIPEGVALQAFSDVRDGQGALASASSEPLPVADDQTPPQMSGGLVGDSNAAPRPFHQLGDSIQVQVRALDGESQVKSVKVSFEPAELFGAAPMTLVRYDNFDRFRLAAPRRLTSYLTAATEAKAIFEAEDLGGNVGRSEVLFEVRPAADPSPPRVRWTSPFTGAAWPAAYTAMAGPEGVPLLLRIATADQTVNGSGATVPGEILGLEVKTAVRQADGSFALEADWRPAELVAGGEPGRAEYQLLWRVPNGLPDGTEIPFAARAWDKGGHRVEAAASLTATPARKVYEGVTTALLANDPMQDPAAPAGAPIFLVGGSQLSLYPQPGGAFRQLPALYLYSGVRRDGTGKLEVEPTRLTTPEISSLSSSVLYYPLELEIGEYLGVAGGAAIDLRGRGLLGGITGSGFVEATLPGIRGASPGAGGSHGGFGLPGDRPSTTYSPPPGEVYDDLRHPRLPGGGGRSKNAQPGGSGGGVARISAAAATVRLEGGLLAGAINRDGPFPPGGAGGAVDLEAGLLEGWGQIDASGGYGAFDGNQGFGGGGRIAVYYREVAADFDWHRQVVAFGGGVASQASVGAAGTVYREQLPESGPPTGLGILQVVNRNLDPPAANTVRLKMPTPIPGVGQGKVFAVDAAGSSLVLDIPSIHGEVAGERLIVASAGVDLGTFGIVSATELAAPGAPEGQRIGLVLTASPAELQPLGSRLAGGETLEFRGLARFLAIEAGGVARVFAESDLALGPQGTLNDLAFITAGPDSKVALRSDYEIRLTPSFGDEVTAVRPGQTVPSPSWVLTHPFGLHELRVGWHPAGPSIEKVLRFWPASYSSGSDGNVGSFRVANDAAPGFFEYRIEVVDLLGRQRQFVRRYEVLANQPPEIAVTSGPTTIRRGGTSGRFDLELSDVEGLAAAGCDTDAEGVHVAAPNPKALSGTSASIYWSISVPVAVTASMVELNFWVEDQAGVRTEVSRTFQVTTGESPTGSLVTIPPGISLIEPGQGFEIRVEVDDPDRDLAQVRITGSGPIQHGYWDFTPNFGTGQQFRTYQIYVDQDAQPGDLIEFTGEVEDVNHNVTPLGPLVVTVASDATKPSIYWEVWGENYTAGPPWYAGQNLEIMIRAWDNAGIATLEGSFLGHDFFEELDPGEDFLEHVFTYQVPVGLAAPFEAVLTAKAVDQAGIVEVVSETHTFLPDLPPTFELSVAPAAEVRPGSLVILYLAAEDDRGLEDVHFRITGGGLDLERSIDFTTTLESLTAGGEEVRLVHKDLWENPTEASLEFRFRVPTVAVAGETISIEVGVDDLGRNLTEEVRTLAVIPPAPLPPRAHIYLQPAAAGDRYAGGQTLTVVATARTDNGPAALTLEATPPISGGQASGNGYLKTSLSLPVVSTPTTLDLVAETTAAGGLSAGATRTITVLPPADPNAPWVRFDCPTGGALLPTGATFGFAISAGGARGLAEVELAEVGSAAPPLAWDPAAATGFAATAAVELGASAGTRTFEVMATDASGATATATIEIELAAATALEAAGANDWTALESQVAVLESGVLSLDAPRRFRGLIVLPGATITHPPYSDGEAVDLTVDETFYLACGAKIDVVGKGYQDGPADHRGAHIGAGAGATLGSTYGSVTRPREPGASGSKPWGQPAIAGSGVVKVAAGRLVVDGAIDAAGQPAGFGSASAGGSIWLSSQGTISGAGTISAAGGDSEGSSGGGGGGAIAIEGELAEDLAARSDVSGGTGSLYQAGPGSLYFRGPGETLGRLVVRGDAQPAGKVQLPYFEMPSFRLTPNVESKLYAPTIPDGQGVLAATLHNLVDWTDLLWIEVLHESGQGSKGFYLAERIEGTSFRLHPAAGQEVSVIEGGEQFRPLHQIGSLEIAGDLEFYSDTALLPLESVVIDGRVDTQVTLAAESVELRAGAVLGPPTYSGPYEAFGLSIAAGDMIAEPGARLEAGSRGWVGGETPASAGGNHLGVGGGGERLTFGNPEYPRSAGQGGHGPLHRGRGGGKIELDAEVVYLPAGTSARADGQMLVYPASGPAGAGGSVLIQANTHLHLAGTVTARGGDGPNGGGGGAVALHYRAFSGSLDQVDAFGGQTTAPTGGGAGTVFLRDLDEEAGELIVDNGGAAKPLPTILPRVGYGNVDYLRPEGTPECERCGGEILPLLQLHPGTVMCGYVVEYQYYDGRRISDLELTPSAIGRTIEISVKDPDTQLPGPPVLRRIGAADGHCAGLEVDYALPPLPAGVDYWQAVYSFTKVRVKNAALEVLDPLRLPGGLEIEGKALLQNLGAIESLVLRPGATLTATPPESSASASPLLELTVAGELRLEPGAKIDVSGQGLTSHYSGASGAQLEAGATHIGVGGRSNPLNVGLAYGGIYSPGEPGAGRGTRGGGVVALRVGQLVLEGADSAILANGSAGIGNMPGAAGGSVLIDTGSLTGLGKIEARGGAGGAAGYGAGGGGAIAVYYQDAEADLIDRIDARGGQSAALPGGPGSIYIYRKGESLRGDLILENGGVSGIAELPEGRNFGAVDGSSGNVAVTSYSPELLYGWYRLEREGMPGDPIHARVDAFGSVFDYGYDGIFVEMQLGFEDQPPELGVLPGDQFEGVYRFDTLTAGVGVSYRTKDEDHIFVTDQPRPGGSPATAAAAKPGLIRIEESGQPGVFRISVPANAVGSLPYRAAHLLGGEKRVSAPFDPESGAELLWPGLPGEVLELELVAPEGSSRSLSIVLPALPGAAGFSQQEP